MLWVSRVQVQGHFFQLEECYTSTGGDFVRMALPSYEVLGGGRSGTPVDQPHSRIGRRRPFPEPAVEPDVIAQKPIARIEPYE